MTTKFMICTLSFHDGYWKLFLKDFNAIKNKWPRNLYTYEFIPTSISLFAQGGTHVVESSDPELVDVITGQLTVLLSQEMWTDYKLLISKK